MYLISIFYTRIRVNTITETLVVGVCPCYTHTPEGHIKEHEGEEWSRIKSYEPFRRVTSLLLIKLM